MAVEGRIDPEVKAANDARDDIVAALKMGTDMGPQALSSFVNALDRLIDAKMSPRRY